MSFKFNKLYFSATLNIKQDTNERKLANQQFQQDTVAKNVALWTDLHAFVDFDRYDGRRREVLVF